MAATEFRNEQIQSLVDNPTESLGVELKRWIDPTIDDGIAKIAKACIAMRNNDGGCIVIGLDNETGQPDPNRPTDVHGLYHFDTIQAIVSRYASDVFEVAVKFVMRDGQEFAVICVPSGVRTPVAAKAGLLATNGTSRLIKEHQVYVRSLSANGTASTTEVKYQDWEKLVSVCMDNREADIGRFLRRHLTAADIDKLRSLPFTIGATPDSGSPNPVLVINPPAQSDGQIPKGDKKIELLQLLNQGEARFWVVAKERNLDLPKHGTFEAGFFIEGQFPPHSANQTFLNKILASNTRFTGWPFWVDSRGFRDESQCAPYHVEDRWEAFVPIVASETMKNWGFTRASLDFWQMFPTGRFYHRRLLEDDAAGLTPDNPPKYLPTPNVVLDTCLPILRVYEVLVLGHRFAKTLGCEPAETTLFFGFRWNGLKGRGLVSWAEPSRLFRVHGPCYEDLILATVAVPLETAESALFQHTHQVVAKLYEAFNGFDEISAKFMENYIIKTFSGRR